MRARYLTRILVLFATLAATGASAQATRTWVSGVGDDANPCSRTAPCKTFAGAISKTAAGGEINVLDPGGFGAVTITKAISIEADGVIAGVLVSGTNGIVVNAGVNDTVVLRGLTIEGLGTGLNGIRWLQGANLVIDRCTINNFTQRGIDAEPTSSTPGAVSNLLVSDTHIRGNAGGGILAKPFGTNGLLATLNRVQFNHNEYGVRAEDNAYVNVRDSVLSQSTTDGAVAQGAYNNAVIYIESSFANNNRQSGLHAIGGKAFIFASNVLVTGNSVGLNAETGGSLYSFGNNRVGGNFDSNGWPTYSVPQR
jgi:hypothetical protein